MSESSEEEIIEAALVDDEDDRRDATAEAPRSSVRQGSPFAHDPPQVEQRARAYAQRSRPFQASLWTFTAGGAVLSAALLVPIGLVSFWFFPGGAVAVAVLGGMMGLMGLSSLHPRRSLGLLAVHMAIFLLAEMRLWM